MIGASSKRHPKLERPQHRSLRRQPTTEPAFAGMAQSSAARTDALIKLGLDGGQARLDDCPRQVGAYTVADSPLHLIAAGTHRELGRAAQVSSFNSLILLVGAAGFELATPCSQIMCARLSPLLMSTPRTAYLSAITSFLCRMPAQCFAPLLPPCCYLFAISPADRRANLQATQRGHSRLSWPRTRRPSWTS